VESVAKVKKVIAKPAKKVVKSKPAQSKGMPGVYTLS